MLQYNLNLRLKCETNPSLDILDRDGIAIPSLQTFESGFAEINAQVAMPNKIVLIVNSPVELVRASLGSIRFSREHLLTKFEYKPDFLNQPKNELNDFISLPSTHSVNWQYNGCVVLDLFDPDPLRYHLHIGTTIS